MPVQVKMQTNLGGKLSFSVELGNAAKVASKDCKKIIRDRFRSGKLIGNQKNK